MIQACVDHRFSVKYMIGCLIGNWSLVKYQPKNSSNQVVGMPESSFVHIFKPAKEAEVRDLSTLV